MCTREKKLRTDLNHPNACKILRRNGYADTSVDAALAHLKMRFASCGGSKEFPHEIGLFLGYPPDDVAGYILNSGKNCKCCGCWKVYCNECETRENFRKIRKMQESLQVHVFPERQNASPAHDCCLDFYHNSHRLGDFDRAFYVCGLNLAAPDFNRRVNCARRLRECEGIVTVRFFGAERDGARCGAAGA